MGMWGLEGFEGVHGGFWFGKRNVEGEMILEFADVLRKIRVRRQNSTTAEEVARFQRLFPNLSWLMSGRTSGHQNLVSIFPGIDNCLKT